MRLSKHEWTGGPEVLIYLAMAGVFYFLLSWQIMTLAATSPSAPAWSNPSIMTLKRVSTLTGAQSSPNLFDNLDCTPATYRLPTTNTMGTGCFTETALGLLESDSDIMIFNGTDEGLLLGTFSPHQVLVPWPQSSALIALDTVSTGGSYISLYRSPQAILKDQRNPLLQLTGKQLTAAPDLPIRDKQGQRLVINPQTLAFSYGGSWLVAETFNGSFVRINLSTLEIKPFAPSFTMSGSPALLKSRLSISADGRFVAIYNQVDDSFKLYDLSDCGAASANLQPESCSSYNYLPFIKSQIGGLQSIRHVRFVNDGLLSFDAYTSNTNDGGIYELAPTDSIDFLIDYLGMGDSYASGEGAFNYVSSTDTNENMCHLSIRSYPLLITNDLFTAQGGHSVACSGAVMQDVVSNDDAYKGQVSGGLDFKHLKDQDPGLLNSVLTNYMPGYIAQQRFVRQYQPKIASLEIGGNDIGFGSLLEQCVGPHLSLHKNANNCFSTYEDRLEILRLIDRTQTKWLGAYKQLKSAAPRSTIYAIGYPQIAYDNGSCALNVHLSQSEITFSNELIDYLNDTIREAANQAKVTYVDISQALVGHRLCESASYNVAVNGLTAGKDAGLLGIGVLGKESYHPNAFGQRLIELEILRQTNNMQPGSPATTGTPAKNTQKILEVPKTGRKIVNLRPVIDLVSKKAAPGSTVKLKAGGTVNGLRSNATYSVRLGSSAGQAITAVSTNETGDIDASFTLPTNTVPGMTTIHVIGDSQANDTIDLAQPIYVITDGDDADGDGTPDNTDSCPFADNSGVDADGDGADDTCDGTIAQTSVAPPANTAAAMPVTSQVDGGSGSLTGLSAHGNITIQGGPSLSAKAISPINAPTTSTFSLSKTPITSNTSRPAGYNNHSNLTRNNDLRFKINWLVWLSAGLLVWLTLVAIGVVADNYFEQRASVA